MMVIAVCVGVAMLPVLYGIHGAWLVSNETTKLSRRRHKDHAKQLVETRVRDAERAAAKRKRLGNVGLWARLMAIGKG